MLITIQSFVAFEKKFVVFEKDFDWRIIPSVNDRVIFWSFEESLKITERIFTHQKVLIGNEQEFDKFYLIVENQETSTKEEFEEVIAKWLYEGFTVVRCINCMYPRPGI